MTKPMMERKRRARINKCLVQLKDMVIDSGNQNIKNSKTKLEKADILELTVKYVESVNERGLREHNSHPKPTNTFTEFIAGFTECAKRVQQFVCEWPSTSPIVVTSLSAHLNKCIETLQTHESNTEGVIRHTSHCCPPSPAPSTLSSVSEVNPMLERDAFEPISSDSDEDMPLNLSSNNSFADHFHNHLLTTDDHMWRPW